MKMYNSDGEAISFSDFIDIEVSDNENYPIDVVESWMYSYDINHDSVVTWATMNYDISNTYNLIAGDDEDNDLTCFDMFEYEVDSEDVIEESEDESGRFLIILER